MRLERVIKRAKENFWANTTVRQPNNSVTPYQTAEAAGDAVSQLVKSTRTAALLCVEAGSRRDVRFDRLYLDGVVGTESIRECLCIILEIMVEAILEQDPKIAAENRRRGD